MVWTEGGVGRAEWTGVRGRGCVSDGQMGLLGRGRGSVDGECGHGCVDWGCTPPPRQPLTQSVRILPNSIRTCFSYVYQKI